ncbi:thiol reductant ABC exporter subunit CydD [Agromyces allii]|uniref:Thiol reductant ABC exporter subunit CydD n=1 Tax=Agromyces allii TaxID=393607 RepID=A0ABP5CRP2_9MICO|nr:thiol reductant ABC exporter subunit CydD [Agromyces allii]
MKPLDPRLVRRSRAARRFLVVGALLALLQAAATVGLAYALASLVAGLIDGERMSQAWPLLVLLVVAASVRALSAWAWELVGSAGAMRVKQELRRDVLVAVERAPAGVPGFSSARTTTLLGPGLDALDAYFGSYLPQLVLTAVATPILIAIAWWADPLSGLVFVIVLPLIPVFMALIGMATQAVQRRQYDSLATLSHGFLEVVGGLSTLIVFGRAKRQVSRIRSVTDDFRKRTMAVLRVTFLSGFTLEFAASLSVAIVAVSIGFRLVWGEIGLLPGLFVLILAPDIFLPVRNVGAAFHASSAGVAASDDAFELFEAARGGGASVPVAPGPVAGRDGIPDAAATVATPAAAAADTGVSLVAAGVRRDGELVVDGVDLAARPGELVAVTGPSGIGKSSLFAGLLGFAPIEGEALVNGERPGAATRAAIAWSPQGATLFAGTVRSNVRLGAEQADAALVERAMRLADVGLDPETPLGAGGSGLSGGQAQRVAIARALHRALATEARIVLLDEPTSAQDPAHEAAIAAGLRELADEGYAVVVATHRAGVTASADRTIALAGAHV